MIYRGRNNFTHQKGYIGIEITNNTPETQDLKFLGIRHRHYRKNGVELKNIFNDTVYDDSDLTMLINWIMSVGRIQSTSVLLASSLTYGNMGKKILQLTETDYVGRQQAIDFNWFSHAQPGFTYRSVRINHPFLISFMTEMSQTSIEAGEVVTIIFDLNKFHSEEQMDDIIAQCNRKFSKEKRRKILLSM